MGLQCGWRHDRKRWSLEIEGYEKESFESWIWAIEDVVVFFRIFTDRNLIHHNMLYALVGLA